MKNLKESILNKRNIVSQGISNSKVESLCISLFELAKTQGFTYFTLDSSLSTTKPQYTFTKDSNSNESEYLLKLVKTLYDNQGFKYKISKSSRDYNKATARLLSYNHKDMFYINIDSKDTSYPDVNIMTKSKNSGNYKIYFSIAAPKEYKKYIS